MTDHGHDHETRLSGYLDGQLDRRELREVEAHLAACAPCRAVLEELEEVRARARALEDRAPDRDLWPRIRDALEEPTVIDLSDHRGGEASPGGGEASPVRGTRPQRRGVFLSLSQLAAAAAALVVLAAGGGWGVAHVWAPGPGAAAADSPGGPEATAFMVDDSAVGTADRLEALALDYGEYAAAVAELQGVLREGGDRLSPGTVRVLGKNLALIDAAIRESLDALAVDPGNPFLEQHLQRSVERKVTYLREAAALLDTTD